MGSNWPVVTLGELIEKKKAFLQTGPFGTALKAAEYSKSGVPLISVREIRDGFIQIGNETPRVDEHTTNRLPKFVLKKGDIVFGRKGGVDRNALVTNVEDGWFLGSDGIYLRLTDGDDAEFISYVLHSRATKAWLIQNCEGTTMPSLNQKILSRLPVYYPPSSEKKKVSLILRHLNQKIALNKQTNQTLDRMAQTLFKSWFVDFDPVFDNALAKADFQLDKLANNFPAELLPKAQARLAALQAKGAHSGVKSANSGVKDAHSETKKADASALNDAIHPHFPSEFEYNEQLGWIPKGWENVAVNEMVNTVSETYPLKKVDKVIFLNTGDILDGKFLHHEFSKTTGLPGQAKKSIRKGDILYSEIRPKNKRFALVNFEGSDHVVSTKLMVLRPKDGFEPLLSYFVLTQENNISRLQRAAESRSGTFPQITYTELSMIKVALPRDRKVSTLFVQEYLQDHYRRKDQFDFQNTTLTKLRDTLLPKLISGELEIPDTLKALEQATS